MEPTPIWPLPLTELAKQIEMLFVQQLDRIEFHHNDTENDYRVQENHLSALMLDKSLSDEKHLEYARAKIERTNSYKKDFIGPLLTLNDEIQRKLLTFEQILYTVPKQPGGMPSAMEQWFSLSKELHLARVIAANSIINQTDFDKRIPTIIIKNNGRSDIAFSEEESKQFLDGIAAYAASMKTSYADNQRIQQEREPLTRQLFPVDDKAKAPETEIPGTARLPITAFHPLEGKAWFRLMKVVYIGSWIVGLGISAVLAYGAGEFFVFVVGAVILAIVLIVLKKVFYYVILGRPTATEKVGKGFVDLEDLRNDLAGVQADSPDVYQEVVAPFFESWKAQYGRRVPLHAVDILHQRVAHEMNAVKEKKQQIINKAAREGATVEISSLRKNLEQSKAEYKGANPQEFIRQVDLFVMSLEAKYGTAIPIDEASKLLDRLEDDIRVNDKAQGG